MEIAEKIQELCIKANEMRSIGDFDNVKNIAYELKEIGSYNALNFASCFFIDSGSVLQEKSIVREGIDILENFKKESIDIPFLNYNLGNGYYVLFGFRFNQKKPNHYFEDTELNNAISNYREALNMDSTPELFTNLGNCYDYLGRVIDAIDVYDRALDINPSHSMALGNKGMALYNYAKMSGNADSFLIEAHSLISAALELGVPQESENSFLITLNIIEKLFPNKKLFLEHLDNEKININYDSNLEKNLTKFCMSNKLYLNICNYCQRCENAIGDPIHIHNMIDSISKMDSKIENNKYYSLSAYLNQIKQDYITSRFLLFLSIDTDMDFSVVDKNVMLINTLDYSKYTIKLQLLKFAFKNIYDILDKIAFFINNYLDLEMGKRDINFMTIWYDKKTKDFPENIKNTNNPSLNAIFHIYTDFKKHGYYRPLKDIRDGLTHRFIKVKGLGESDDEEIISEEQFLEYTFQLSKIVRNCIIYLMCFVDNEEKKKKSKIDGPIGNLYPDMIPDDLKDF